ncbi:hypothetical protein G6F57_009794 [Rhizopus arrhizus]|uniref:Uncharacterized protein n=1 Tax=Rhizopus oryzae TaxID=64495 RepID=A0A9P6X2E8_RHIOR|nr:hypothetical protein G6F24_007398 [Rhizopus arrhizus]KAG0786208.1 hypothetical protein G6F21_008753 [Rhizopus arrhizus]KAG0941042.1 hypothetical protein G6F32_008574 [Rhizopus arrhizus]KAG0961763.1 hypothetical protein G6F31_009334 [Rhizopus arrhizus]KAG1120947.1 hypothetical protein G6F40_000267 [Rhizopus arrhizus]
MLTYSLIQLPSSSGIEVAPSLSVTYLDVIAPVLLSLWQLHWIFIFEEINSGLKNTKHITTPIVASYKFPLSKYLFAPSPLTKSILNFIRNLFNILRKPQPVNTEPTKSPAKQPISMVDTFQKAEQMFLANVKNTKTSTLNFLNSNTNSVYRDSLTDIKEASKASKLERDSLKEQVFGTESTHLPTLRFVPCIQAPTTPLVKRDRSLWHLARTPQLTEEFRMEQAEAYHQDWSKFNDERSRTHYHKPLLKSIESFEIVLSNSGQNIVTCDPKFMAITMLLPEFNNNENFLFNLSEIHQLITINGRTDAESKKYTLERVKELSSSQRMAAFRGIPKIKGMPSDAEIIFYIVRTYLKMREPHIVPPLLPLEGDVFKFLLIYIKMTPELSWGVF